MTSVCSVLYGSIILNIIKYSNYYYQEFYTYMHKNCRYPSIGLNASYRILSQKSFRCISTYNRLGSLYSIMQTQQDTLKALLISYKWPQRFPVKVYTACSASYEQKRMINCGSGLCLMSFSLHIMQLSHNHHLILSNCLV